ncbi:Helix-turn-helix domain-containing protein [Sinosporangium album]|uniref:Helix-turn-helix domain-containing protein n=1 Tax=Sinosporangium album TaxID=504805 RepID=A0A1G8LRB0_9ACTN|nr:Helix-turn-helix domain-containing protein [Sinosporangium album]
MPAPKELNPDDSPQALFGFELRRRREALGLSQVQLGARIRFSSSLIGQVERAAKRPTRAFVERCEEALGLQGELLQLWPNLAQEASPRWFRNWLDVEAAADAIRSWEPLLLPGLLQTEDYARAVISGKPGATSEQVEEVLAVRMARQKVVFGRSDPPLFWAVIDESVLRRPIGGREVMRDQLEHLLEVVRSPRVSIQVVPFELGSTTGLSGAFAIAQAQGTPDTVYLESAGAGHVSDRSEDVHAINLRYEAIRGDAHSQRASTEMIRETMVTVWTS